MRDKIFLDTNIVVYIYSEDEALKQQKSLSLTDFYDCIISIQVINEFTNTLRKKFKFEYNAIESAIKELTENFTIATQSLQTVFSAFKIAIQYGYSYYDSLIVATALENGCKILYSEDMQNNQVIGNVMTIINPYLHD